MNKIFIAVMLSFALTSCGYRDGLNSFERCQVGCKDTFRTPDGAFSERALDKDGVNSCIKMCMDYASGSTK